MDEKREKTVWAFLIGLFLGRFGIPIITHGVYWSIIIILLIKRMPDIWQCITTCPPQLLLVSLLCTYLFQRR